MDHPRHRGGRHRPRGARERRHRDGRRDPDRADPHARATRPGSQCFFVDGCLVSGDTLFLEGCGRTDLPGGDPAALYDSLTQKLAKVPDDAVLFPGHLYSAEPSATMSETRRWNYVFKPGSEAEWLAMFGR